MKLQYLRKEELEALLPVATTKEEAQQIKKRCTGVLELLRHRIEGVVEIGCPHCRGSCLTCAYNRVADPGEEGDGDEEACFDLKFAGLCLADARYTWFYSGHAQVDLEKADSARIQAEIGFLKAHIEWAKVIIALGGTCQSSWRMLDVKQRKAWKPPKLEQVIKQLKLSFPEAMLLALGMVKLAKRKKPDLALADVKE